MTDPTGDPPPVLEYGNRASTGPGTFDRVIGTLLYSLSGICVCSAVFVVGWLAVVRRFTPIVVFAAAVGVA